MSHAPVRMELKRGGNAYIVAHEPAGELVTVASTAPSPPGSTLEATHQAEGRSVTVRVKVRGCRRDCLPDGRQGYRLEGRFVSLTRADRDALFGSQRETDSGSTSET
jgi:hypothetical protein